MEAQLTQNLREWYTREARDLPWRVGPDAWSKGERADPYHIWISEMMLQQTTVATVREQFKQFLKRFPDVKALAAASQDEVLAQWAGLGYYARARNLHKAALIVAKEGFPKTREELMALPGIGAYASAAIASIAFDEASPVVDGNVERIISRVYRLPTPPSKAKKEIEKLAGGLTPVEDPGNHAQAMMDLAATICRPKAPMCLLCPISGQCAAFSKGDQESFPVKVPKKKKPTRVGSIGVARVGDHWVLERRPETGLLAGTLGWPGGDWREDVNDVLLPLSGDWEKVGMVKHTFTHFHLELDVYALTVPEAILSDRLELVHVSAFNGKELPTVMRKVYEMALSYFE